MTGSKRVLVVGGATEGTAALDGFCEELAQAGVRVERVDYPVWSDDVEFMDAMVERIQEQISSDRGDCHLVGYSLGAQVGLHLALADPEACASMILIAPRARTTDFQRALHHLLLDVATSCSPPSFAALSASLLLSPGTLSDPDISADWLDIIAPPHDLASYRWWVQGSLGPDVRSWLASVTTPVLVVAFEHDRIVLPAASVEVSESLARAVMVHLPDLGHLGLVEAPRIVAQCVASFLSRGIDDYRGGPRT